MDKKGKAGLVVMGCLCSFDKWPVVLIDFLTHADIIWGNKPQLRECLYQIDEIVIGSDGRRPSPHWEVPPLERWY